jgi:hypothetical protein
MKLRLHQATKDAISNARRVFGCDDNSVEKITRKALRWLNNNLQPIPELNGVGIGNPITIRASHIYCSKDLQSIIILYINAKIESSTSRRQYPVQVDPCDNYKIIEGK